MHFERKLAYNYFLGFQIDMQYEVVSDPILQSSTIGVSVMIRSFDTQVQQQQLIDF